MFDALEATMPLLLFPTGAFESAIILGGWETKLADDSLCNEELEDKLVEKEVPDWKTSSFLLFQLLLRTCGDTEDPTISKLIGGAVGLLW